MAVVRRSDREQALVITPTYNERDSIGRAIARLFEAATDRVDLLVVDDGSPDGTGDLVRELAEGPHEIHLMERGEKLGLGTAYIAGFKWAIERGYPAVVEMDADLSHDPAAVPRLLDALENADLAIGSRYVPGGAVENWSRTRQLLSRGGNAYARAWLGFPVHDATAGFRAYRTELLQQLDLDSVTSEGYGFQIEMTRRVYKHGGRIVEVPITFVERVAGHSKMSKQIVVEALTSVTRWGIHDRFRRTGH
ncbi:MAG: dolichol-phosphate mannosyltransferase [Actinomycetota bacterium]|nr:dolichol-phosphate mannosyltransferase [Actinomycetota bacterium]